MKHRRRFVWLVLIIVASLVLAACGGGTADTPTASEGVAPAAPGASQAAETGAADTAGGTTIRYALWDANQLPAYEACATKFKEQNPNITVKVEQLGWDDYWSNIQNGFVSSNAPDVFTDHLAKYPEFATKEQIVDIQPLVDRDKVDAGMYIGELASLWMRDGKRYGLPKDWDTIALVYNKDMLEAAGVDEASLQSLTWNPQDGGSVTELFQKLTLDANGNNATSPDFDPNNITQYGFIPDGAGAPYGQTQWSSFAVSNGFKYNDGPWDTKINYSDPKLAEAVQWYADLNLKYYVAPPLADISSLGAATLFTSGKGAFTQNGSWMIGQFTRDASFPVGFAPLPEGPQGRKSMFNGLADSIWVGSQNQEEAWEWVKFAASKECADLVGSFGIVFPAQQSGVDAAIATYEEKGVDVKAFTDIAADENATFLFPITDYGADISSITAPIFDSIMLGDVTAADGLKQANDEVNALFQ